MPNQAISDIHQFMQQIDMTNTNRIEELLRAYTTAVKEYNGICGQLHSFIKNGMVEEMEHFLNELDPTLQERYKELQDPTVKEFLDTAEMYGMEVPIAEDIFDELGEAVLKNMGLKSLIIRYRQVARSNKTQEKLTIIRQIIAQSPDDQLEWEHTLVSLEEEWKEQLQESAKQAIIAGEYQDLEAIQKTILAEPWKRPFNEKVVNKIQQVLDEERRRYNQRLCEQLLQTAEDGMESEGKINERELILGKMLVLQKIQRLLSEDEVLQMPSEWMEHLQKVSEIWEKAKKQSDEKVLFDNLFVKLEQKMADNASLEEVENIYYDMQRLRQEIPEITVSKINAYRQGKIAIAKRKRLVASGIGILVFIALVIAGVIVFKNIARNRTIMEYSAKLRTVIDDASTLSDTGFDILKEVETKVPGIRNTEAITALADELKAKKENEESRRVKFDELKLTLSQQLENYAEHAPAIMETVKELQKQALPEHQNTLDELMKKHDEQRAKYVRAQDATYRKFCAEAGDSFIAMKAQLAKYDIDKAWECQNTIREKIKKAEQIADVSFEAKNSMASLVAEYAKAGELMNQGTIDNELNNRLKKVEDWYDSLQELVKIQNLKLALEKFHDQKKMEDMVKSLENEIEKGSFPLKKRWEDVQVKMDKVGHDLQALGKLIDEEIQAIMTAIKKSDLKEIQKALREVRIKYPNCCLNHDMELLSNEISRCLNADFSKYDIEENTKSGRFRKKLDVLGKSIKEMLQKKYDDYIKKPIYMMAFYNIDTHSDIEIYMKPSASDNNKGLKFEKRTRIDDYNLKNIMGLEKNANILINDDMSSLKFGDGPSIAVSLSYPLFLKKKNLAEVQYKDMGPYGNWLTSSVSDITKIDLTRIQGYQFLDKALNDLLAMKVDGIRSVQLFLDIANTMLTIDPCFAEGGEFELREILYLKKNLESLLEYLPKDYSWYSVSWKYSDEIKVFYAKLKEFCGQSKKISYRENPFSSAVERLSLANENTTLLPIGIYFNPMINQNLLVNPEKNRNGVINSLFSLKDGTQGGLFIADYDNMKSVRIGDFTVIGSKIEGTMEDKFNNVMLIVYIKR